MPAWRAVCPGVLEWGTLTGRIVYDGKAPAPAPIKVDKDPEVCNKHPLIDESLEVGPTGGLKNALDLSAHRKGRRGSRV